MRGKAVHQFKGNPSVWINLMPRAFAIPMARSSFPSTSTRCFHIAVSWDSVVTEPLGLGAIV